MDKVKRPLALKIPIVGFVFALVLSLLVGFSLYWQNNQAVVENGLQKLAIESEIIKPLVTGFYQQAAEDISFLAETPSAKQLYLPKNAIEAQGAEHEQGLQGILVELLRSHSHYNKISFIKVNDTIDVQVSAMRESGDIYSLPSEQLPKDISLEALGPMLNASNAELFFSDIEFQERSSTKSEAIFYAAMPLINSARQLVALLAIEVNLTKYIEQIKSNILKDIPFYLADSKGRMLFPSEVNHGNESNFNLKKLVESGGTTSFVNSDKLFITRYKNPVTRANLAFYTPVEFEHFPQQHPFQLLVENQSQQLDAETDNLRYRTVVIGLVLGSVSLVILVYAANSLTKPLLQMSESIAKYEKTKELSGLPLQAQDEIGAVARSFKELVNNLTRSYNDQQIAAKTAKESNLKLEAILDSIADAVINIDECGTVLSFNRAATNIFGYQEQEVVGKNIKMLMPEDIAQQHDHYLAQYLTSGVAKIIGSGRELPAVRKDGETFPMYLCVSEVKTSEGVIFTGLIRDITPIKLIESERLRMLQDAKNSAWRLNFALSGPNIGVWDLNLSTGRFHWDERMYKLFCCDVDAKFSPKELWRERTHQADVESIEAQLNRLTSFGREAQYEHRIVLPDGQIKYLEAHAKLMFSDSGEKSRIVGTYRDITEQYEVQKLKQQALDMAEASLKLKSEFLASMSHEIRTPMNGVIGMLGLLSQSQLSKQQKHHLSLASSSANSLLSLINDILDFSKIEAGKLDFESIEFDMLDQLGEFAESMAFKAQDKDLELILDVTQLNHSVVKGDPGRLRQILSNLVGNAIKFTHQGEVVIRANVEDIGPRVRLTCSVNDTGIGIPADKLQGLFDSFTQVDASTTRQYGGTGLGLAIVKQLCDLMDGGIEVKSQQGKGSSFTFHVCFEKGDAVSISSPDVEIENRTVLIVDDNETNLEVLKGQLEVWGARVYVANDGFIALNVLNEKGLDFFDVAVLDMQMPDMDGATLGKKIKEMPEGGLLPLIMMTSMSERGDTEFFKNLGFSAFFPKPATVSDLFDALKIVLAPDSKNQLTSIITSSQLASAHKREMAKDLPKQARLMVVEDNRINQVVLLGILENLGLVADVAGNGQEAIDLLVSCPEDAPYQLLIMDCQMPELDGYETTEAIRIGKAGNRFKDIPIIAMTANAMKGDEEKCKQAGMNDYATKPIDADVLQQKLCLWLGKKKDESEERIAVDLENQLVSEADPDVTQAEVADVVWDKSNFFNRIRHNQVLASKLINLYLEDMPALISQLSDACKAKDSKLVSSIAHKIKGSSRNLAAQKLADISQEIETSFADDFRAENAVLVEQLERAFSELKNEIADKNLC